MKKSTVIFLVFSVFSISMKAQCYLQKTEASGFNVSQFQTSLNQAACALRDSLPTEFQSQFKVITFGLYSLAPTFNSGIAPMLAKAKQDAESESPYYLLIVRESSSNGIFTNFHIEVKLPSSGAFSCVDSTKNQIIRQTIFQAINDQYLSNDKSPYFYAQAEIAGMNVLSKIFGTLKTGNCCIPSDEAVENWLLSEGFVKLNLNCKVLGPLVARPNDPQNRKLSDYVTDYANLSISVNNEAIDIKQELNNFIESKNYENSNPKIYIVKNQSICNGDYATSELDVIDNLPFVGCIVYIQDRFANFQGDNIWVRVEGCLSSDLPNSVSENEGYLPPPPGASNFQDLVNTIRQAEEILIANGHTKISDRIKILRGIYYGTPWSMDHAQTYGSDDRDLGFKVYLCNHDVPLNPQQLFGNALYQKLRDSPEVSNGGVGVDWGHIIIALESRLSYCSSENTISFHESSGLEIVTWIGDIGGGAGMLAIKRVSNPNKRAIDMFTNSHDFGGWYNLEGDIAALLVGRNTGSNDPSPSFELKDSDFIADAVQAYLLPQPSPNGSEWNQRAKTFLKFLGGNIDNSGTLTNENELVDYLSEEVEDFAENYVAIKVYGGENISLYETSRHFKGAAKEMTQIFIHTIKKAMANPNLPIKASGINPNPTQPGEPYMKYKSWEKTKEIIKEIEDFLKH